MPKITETTVRRRRHEAAGHPCGPHEAFLYSDSGGLTQFGALVEILPPGSFSSVTHWHAQEDEMIYVIEGTATVKEGDEVYTLTPGEGATFKAGNPLGHQVENTSDQPLKYLVIGTRSRADTVTYPDHDRVLRFARDDTGNVVEREYTTLRGAPAGSPYVTDIDDS